MAMIDEEGTSTLVGPATGPKASTGRRRRRALLGLCSIAALVAACAAPDAEEEREVAAVQGALEGEEPEAPIAPVAVTSGTCKSRGFQPIADPTQCTEAFNTLFGSSGAVPVAGPLNTPSHQSNLFGCSVSVASAAGGGRELQASFAAGSQAQLNAQECSHDVPCLCEQPAPAQDVGLARIKDVCKDGVFTPDPKKYYTIRSPYGRYIRGRNGRLPPYQLDGFTNAVILTPIASDPRDPYLQPKWTETFFTTMEFDQVADPSDSRLHWRFEANGAGHLTISRHLGEQLVSKEGIGTKTVGGTLIPDLDGGTGLELMAYPGNPRPMSFRCIGSQVVLEQDGRSPVDVGGMLPEDHPRALDASLPSVLTKPQSPGYVERESDCMRKNKGCSDAFGPGYFQTGRRKCGGIKHVLSCKKLLEVPVSMHVPQGWIVEEVEAFRPALDFELGPVVAPVVSAPAIGNSMATFGLSSLGSLGAGGATFTAATAGLAGGPLYGALFSIGFNGLLGAGKGLGILNQQDPVALLTADVNQALADLAISMDARAEDLVDQGIITAQVQTLINTMGTRRHFFLRGEYFDAREADLPNGGVAEAESLFTMIRGAATEYDANVDVLFPTIADPYTATDDQVKQAHFGLNVAKLATTEVLIMASEAVLMKTLAFDHDCDQIMNSLSLQDRVDRFTTKLKNAQEALIAYGVAHPEQRTNFGVGPSDMFEFDYDARNFSYPIEDQLEFFRNIIEDTHKKCLRMRQPQDPFKAHFIANTPPPPAPEVIWPNVSQVGTHAEVSEPLIGDIDGDGDLDVVTKHHNARRIVAWVNTEGVLAESHELAWSQKPFSPDMPDLDGDGDLDLVLGGLPRLAFAENVGSSYAGPTTLVDGAIHNRVMAMRVDGDLLPDVVAFDKSNGQLVLSLNQSTLNGINLAAPTLIDSVSSNAFGGPGMAAVDVDGDDDLDLVLSLDNELSLYENVSGVFSAPTTIDTVGFGSFVYAADLDKDGDDDILGVRGGDVFWYENLGNGGFGPEQTIATGTFDQRLAVGDLDGDLDSDIVLYDKVTGDLMWVENANHGLFLRGKLGNISSLSGLAIGDLDGDNDGDLVITNGSSDLITFLNPLRSPSVE